LGTSGKLKSKVGQDKRGRHKRAPNPLCQDIKAGFDVVHLPTGALVSRFQFLATCEEIYDICVLPGLTRPGILGLALDIHRQGLSRPQGSFWDKVGDGKLEKLADK